MNSTAYTSNTYTLWTIDRSSQRAVSWLPFSVFGPSYLTTLFIRPSIFVTFVSLPACLCPAHMFRPLSFGQFSHFHSFVPLMSDDHHHHHNKEALLDPPQIFSGLLDLLVRLRGWGRLGPGWVLGFGLDFAHISFFSSFSFDEISREKRTPTLGSRSDRATE